VQQNPPFPLSNNTYIPNGRKKKKKGGGGTKSPGSSDQKSITPVSSGERLVANNVRKSKALPLTLKSKSKSSKKVSPPPSPMRNVIKLEDLPPQDKDDPETIMSRLKGLMDRTQMSQKQLQKWDKKNGLPKSHSQTMVNSSRSRKQLQNGVILKKWNGDPLIAPVVGGGGEETTTISQEEEISSSQEESEEPKTPQEGKTSSSQEESAKQNNQTISSNVEEIKQTDEDQANMDVRCSEDSGAVSLETKDANDISNQKKGDDPSLDNPKQSMQ